MSDLEQLAIQRDQGGIRNEPESLQTATSMHVFRRKGL